MFYSHNILTKKGGSLGIVWIAANFQPGVHHISLTRREYCSVDVRKACEEVISPCNPMALRLSASLLVGIVRVHRQQAHYTYVESKHVWQRIKHTYEKNRPTTDLPTGHTRADTVTLPDPTSQTMLNATFPGSDYPFSLESLLMNDLFSMTVALTSETPSSAHPTRNTDGSPYTADPREISMEDENEAPLEHMQIQIPGEGGDFGDGVLGECAGGPVVMVDNVPMPTLNMSDSMSVGGEVADCSSDRGEVMVAAPSRVDDVGEREEEREEGTDSVLLFDEKTDSFLPYKESQEDKQPMKAEHGTPVSEPAMRMLDAGTRHNQIQGRGRPAAGKRVRRKLAFDALIKTKSSSTKENISSAHTILRDKHTLCCPVPGRVKPALLLSHPIHVASLRNTQLLPLWQSHYQLDLEDQPEFELEPLERDTAQLHRTSSVSSMLSDKEVAREHSASRLSSPGGSAVEVLRAGDDRSLDSHHTTGLTATLSDVSSFSSMRHHSHLGFETSSAQRQAGASRVPLPGMEGLSPIADVDGETESSQNSQFGGFPDLDVSYGSTGGTPRVMGAGGQAGNQVSPTTECEPLAYLSRVSRVMGGRLKIEFRELLSQNSSRRTACRAFAHILELVTSQVLNARQDQPYGAIILQRGEQF